MSIAAEESGHQDYKFSSTDSRFLIHDAQQKLDLFLFASAVQELQILGIVGPWSWVSFSVGG